MTTRINTPLEHKLCTTLALESPDQLNHFLQLEGMTRYNEILVSLQSLRHGDSSTEPPSDDPMSSSPATQAADIAVQAHEARRARKKVKKQADDVNENTSSEVVTYTYKIAKPQPTIFLPPNYPFRTTESGYPIFRERTQEPRRASMATAQGFEDPRITAFVDHWTKVYKDMGNDPFSRAEGMFQLQLACEVRGLVTYGKMDKLVVRLAERALRDAARGWSELSDKVGKVTLGAPPAAPAMVAESEEEMDDGELW